MMLLQIIGYVLATVAIVAASSLLVVIVGWAAGHAEGFFHRLSTDKLERDAQKKQNELNAVRVLKPNEQGRQGIVFDGKTYRDVDSGEVFTIELVKHLDPMRFQLNQIQKTLMAMQGISIQPRDTVAELMAGEAQGELPSYVDLLSLTEKQPVTLDNLIVGVSLDEHGKQFVIRKSIHDLMHLMVISITGAGKSSWVLSFLAEIAMVQEPIEVVCIDVHGSAFNILRDWNKLRFPVARDNKQAVSLLAKVFEEADRRKALYEEVPMADNITTYNQYTEGEKLVPWLLVIDEGTLMLSDKGVSEYVARAVQGTRQYGMYCFMTGQTAKASVVSTPIRDNFPTRIAFNNEPISQRVVLGCTPPGRLEELPGRGWVRLKGKNVPLKMQAPYIRRQAFKDLIQSDGPRNDMPIIEGEYVDFDEQVKGAADGLDKVSISAVCRQLGRPAGGEPFYQVRDSLQKQGLV